MFANKGVNNRAIESCITSCCCIFSPVTIERVRLTDSTDTSVNPHYGLVTVLGDGDGGDGGVVMGGEGENTTAGHGGITMVASLVTPIHHLSHPCHHLHHKCL